jgi:hypothetical protein
MDMMGYTRQQIIKGKDSQSELWKENYSFRDWKKAEVLKAA